MPESDRDLLIAVKTKVDEIHRDMVLPGGRVPNLEKTVDEHSKQLSKASGAFSVAVWIIGAAITLLGSGLVIHIVVGK